MALVRQYFLGSGKNYYADRKMTKLRENNSYNIKNFRKEIGKDKNKAGEKIIWPLLEGKFLI